MFVVVPNHQDPTHVSTHQYMLLENHVFFQNICFFVSRFVTISLS